jgi:DNA-3-methyladenine glycosylase
MIIKRDFYMGDTVEIAKNLLGMRLVRVTEEGVTSGVITETEAYLGEIDDAAHSYKGPTKRVRVQYGEKGLAYIYMIYGMYNCMNITCGAEGKPEAILIRALEPREGIELMRSRRKREKLTELCSGPGKLCKAMSIDKSLYGVDLCTCESGLYLEYGERPKEIEASKRVNIDYAVNMRDKLWRFTIKDSPYVSK